MIAIGCDHGGYALKQEIIRYLEEKQLPYKDFGCYSEESVDYPEYGLKTAEAVADGTCEKGIVLCGTGVGISLAANKVPGIRCALCSDCFTAKATRQHNDANMLAMGGRVVGPGLAIQILEVFLNTPFSNGERHVRRLEQLSQIEKKYTGGV